LAGNPGAQTTGTMMLLLDPAWDKFRNSVAGDSHAVFITHLSQVCVWARRCVVFVWVPTNNRACVHVH
jgi:hypothetical protein